MGSMSPHSTEEISDELAGDRVPSPAAAGKAGWADSPSQAHLPMTSGSQAPLKEGEGMKEGLAKACLKAPSMEGTGDLNWGNLRGGRRGSRGKRTRETHWGKGSVSISTVSQK